MKLVLVPRPASSAPGSMITVLGTTYRVIDSAYAGWVADGSLLSFSSFQVLTVDAAKAN